MPTQASILETPNSKQGNILTLDESARATGFQAVFDSEDCSNILVHFLPSLFPGQPHLKFWKPQFFMFNYPCEFSQEARRGGIGLD